MRTHICVYPNPHIESPQGLAPILHCTGGESDAYTYGCTYAYTDVLIMMSAYPYAYPYMHANSYL